MHSLLLFLVLINHESVSWHEQWIRPPGAFGNVRGWNKLRKNDFRVCDNFFPPSFSLSTWYGLWRWLGVKYKYVRSVYLPFVLGLYVSLASTHSVIIPQYRSEYLYLPADQQLMSLVRTHRKFSAGFVSEVYKTVCKHCCRGTKRKAELTESAALSFLCANCQFLCQKEMTECIYIAVSSCLPLRCWEIRNIILCAWCLGYHPCHNW